MRYFLPNPRQTNIAIALACAAFFAAFYLRTFVLGSREVELDCAAGLLRATCFLRNATADFRDTQLFGGMAMIAAAWHLWKPDFRVFLLAVSTAVFGLLLYNTPLSALAAGLLILSFARPVPLPRPMQARPAAPRTREPASSRRPR